MRDLIEAAERSVGGCNQFNLSHRDLAILALSAHPDFFPALKLFADLKAQDAALVERMARGIHDAPDMADTIWPDAENDNGYRGSGGYVRLCHWPNLYRDTARAIMQELTK